jgi:hypothetical protein
MLAPKLLVRAEGFERFDRNNATGISLGSRWYLAQLSLRQSALPLLARDLLV